jgi:hypothetical protein
MKTLILIPLAVAILGWMPVSAESFRPPAVPLVTFDPFLSVWSAADHLTDRATQHWTKRPHSLDSLIRVDATAFRLMGAEPESVPALPQTGLQVTPTRSIYDFENEKVHVTLTFMRPALPDDLDAMALPLSYLTWAVRAVDGKEHAVAIYDSTSSQLVVNRADEPVEWSRATMGSLTALRMGTVAQPILGSSGDNHRINWGYAYCAAAANQSSAAIGSNEALAAAFVAQGELPAKDDTLMPRAADQDQPVMAFVFNLGNVSSTTVTRQVIVAYDEIYAIKYFGRKLAPYWRRNGAGPSEMLQGAARNYEALAKRCVAFDEQLVADATRIGGAKYAQLCALAYRQCACACGLAADGNKQPLFFTKENTSNGDIGTVDVFFPMDPQWILLSPTLAKATLVPILSYASTWHWKFPNAPHDLGTYPIARGTDDGGEGMPVEESGNMLILCDAVAQAEGNANFVSPWWPKLTEWAQYLEQYGLDPENQLCTDDFMGHLAHNANLSVKAILGLAAYGDLCRMRGDQPTAEKYQKMARTDAQHWMQVAADGDHYVLAFDKTNTWSQKYNLVWDRILDLNIFPPEVAQKEIAHYKTVMLQYGVPLDSRTHLTKTDWTVWSASMASNQSDFEAIISPTYDYFDKTTTRDPLADSYTTDKVGSGGMHARPVVGGIFIKLLTDRAVWKKWAGADQTKTGNWAPLPEPPQITDIVATSQKESVTWHYTIEKPADNWNKTEFDQSGWQEGSAPFGRAGRGAGTPVKTDWNTAEIWLRREFTLPATPAANPQFYVRHDEDVDIYVNGILASSEGGSAPGYTLLDIRPAALALLKPGATVTVAVHCHQASRRHAVDVGLVNVVERD